MLKEVLIFENTDSVARNAKSYDLARIQTDGERLIFAEQLTEERFHLKSQFLDKQKREMTIGEMMLNSEQTLPSMTCMLLMLGTIRTTCQSLQLHRDPSRIWNSVELHKQNEVLGGKVLSRHSLINHLSETLHPDLHLLVLSSPDVASIVLFRSKASSASLLARSSPR